MRRKILKSTACVVAIALILAVTACGGSDSLANGTDITDAEDTADTQDEANAEVNEDETDMNGEAGADSGEEAVDKDDYVVLADLDRKSVV